MKLRALCPQIPHSLASTVGHSVDVAIQLSLNGTIVSVGQLGPDFLILRQPFDHPPSQAELVVSIDGEVRQWEVALPDDISREEERMRIARPHAWSHNLSAMMILDFTGSHWSARVRMI